MARYGQGGGISGSDAELFTMVLEQLSVGAVAPAILIFVFTLLAAVGTLKKSKGVVGCGIFFGFVLGIIAIVLYVIMFGLGSQGLAELDAQTGGAVSQFEEQCTFELPKAKSQLATNEKKWEDAKATYGVADADTEKLFQDAKYIFGEFETMCGCYDVLASALGSLATAAIMNIIVTILAFFAYCGMCSSVKAATKEENPVA